MEETYLSDCCDAPPFGELETDWLEGWTRIIKNTPLGNVPGQNLDEPKKSGKCVRCKDNSMFHKEEIE